LRRLTLLQVIVLAAVERSGGAAQLHEIAAACPGLSRSEVQRVVYALAAKGRLDEETRGRGRSTWESTYAAPEQGGLIALLHHLLEEEGR